jgi:hypothetical protein
VSLTPTANLELYVSSEIRYRRFTSEAHPLVVDAVPASALRPIVVRSVKSIARCYQLTRLHICCSARFGNSFFRRHAFHRCVMDVDSGICADA